MSSIDLPTRWAYKPFLPKSYQTNYPLITNTITNALPSGVHPPPPLHGRYCPCIRVRYIYRCHQCANASCVSVWIFIYQQMNVAFVENLIFILATVDVLGCALQCQWSLSCSFRWSIKETVWPFGMLPFCS